MTRLSVWPRLVGGIASRLCSRLLLTVVWLVGVSLSRVMCLVVVLSGWLRWLRVCVCALAVCVVRVGAICAGLIAVSVSVCLVLLCVSVTLVASRLQCRGLLFLSWVCCIPATVTVVLLRLFLLCRSLLVCSSSGLCVVF